MFLFVILIFELRGLEDKIPKLAIKEIQERQDLLNELHPLNRYKVDSGKTNKKCLTHFDPDARAFGLRN